MGSVQGPTPAYGQRLLPTLVDEEAINNPNRLIYSFAKTTKAADGFVDVSIKRLANSVNRAAWWIEKLLGKGKNFPSVGYTGPGDLRYQILTLALVKAGYKILLNSPRNSIEGHLNVIKKAECNIWMLPSHGSGNISEVLRAHPMTVLDCPELDFFIDETPVPHYAYNKTWAEASTEPILVLHTSGSTGLPKPIVVRHALGGTMDAQHLIKCEDGEKLQTKFWAGARAFSSFPAFHGAGIFINLFSALYHEMDIVLASPSVPVTSNLVDDMVEHANIDALMIAPSTVEEIASSPSSLELLQKKNIKFIGYGGGPVGQLAGDIVAKVTVICNLLGSTEASLFALIWTGNEDWRYFKFHSVNGLKFVERANGFYEMFVVRDPKLQHVQGIFHTFPELNEISTKDLFEKHPTRPDLWLYRGRADDIIVFSNGEKLNPITMEQTINEHPAVRSAIVVGQARFQPAVIIELVDPIQVTEENKKDLIASIQPFIDAANKGSPSHGQIKDGFVTFTNPEKPFLRAAKGTVQRAATVQLYEAEIEELFSNAEGDDDNDLETSSLDSLTSSLKNLVAKIADVKDLDVNVDIFAGGSFDSLLVLTLLRQLRWALKKDGVESQKLQASTIYNNPTVKSLASTLYKLARPSESQEGASNTAFDERQQIFEKYAKNLPTKVCGTAKDSTSQISVILTGSTGSMGSYILDNLVSLPHVSRIYALNRAANGEERQRGASDSHSLKTDFSKVRFFKTDMSQPRFGLDQEKYDELLSNTTHIIHNQWQVDFNLSLASFEPHIRGVRNLIDFSAESKHNALLSFISSIGVTQGKNWDKPVPELIIDDWNAAAMGYGASKLISEVLLVEANKVGGVRTQILRVGQVAGPVRKETGRWNPQEWFPTIVSTSQYMKCVPNKLAAMDRIDWIPVDVLSKIVVDLADLSDPSKTSTDSTSTIFFHLVNPLSIRWSDINHVLVEDIGSECEIVEWSEWVDRLRASAERGEFKENRGIKLLEFYDVVGKGAPLATLETEKTVEKSETLGKVGLVNEDWLKLWMRQWRA